MTANTTTWIHRVTAGAFLAAASALIALGAAPASHADAPGAPSIRTAPSYSPAPKSLPETHWSWHQRHAAEQQAKYR